jgi:hypothetical protein
MLFAEIVLTNVLFCDRTMARFRSVFILNLLTHCYRYLSP